MGWVELLKQWEAVMARRHMDRSQELKKHTRELVPLKVGDTFSVQNQDGDTPLRYTIKVDSSMRLTNRNRRFL